IAWLSKFADLNYNPGFPQFDILLDNGDDNDGDDDDNGDDNIDDDEYAQDFSRGFFRYVQFIKIYDEVEPVVNVMEPAECFAGIGPDNCVAEVTLTFEAFDECSDVSVSVELDADYSLADGFERTRFLTTSEVVANGDDTYTVRLSGIPVGNHALRIRAGDGCGNFDVDILEFCVTPEKAPTPICIQTLTVTLMPDGNGGGMAAIWATDFIASDVTDCFGNVIDKYSIYTEEEATEAGFAPAVGRIGIDLTCEDFGEDVNVRVYAIDNAGNADYCSVVLEVQAFQDGLCDGSSGSLSGAITTQDDDLMGGVEVTVTGANNMDEMVVTDANGQYSFGNLPLDADYTVQPEYNAAFDFAAVTVTDLVAITGHILGSAVLETGYDNVAADANMDGSVDIRDLVSIRRVILGLDNDLNAAGATWRFVSADYNLTTSNWSAAFPEVYNVNNLQGNLRDGDFIAMQLGDVVRAGGRAALDLNVQDAELAAGQTHTVELTSGELAGFQGTLELAAGLELVNVAYEGEGALNLNRASEGLIAMAFNGAAVINVEVRATEAVRLSDAVALTDAITLREGVAANGTAGSLNLNFAGQAEAELVNALEQNMPNPVAETTRIAYTLATAGQVTLNIQDIQGRTVLVRELEGAAGRNVIELNVSELGGATGVLSYTVTAGDFTATKKMVVVR
ncbi:T9SS type A sorting domain-containing protein, partial [Lewinella sp. W8]|uniref:T9SS type A sorting domain-containing protein n=1 Tax=Lewinella sp. W8 TaxID=2528208 RepID=UPI0012B593DB